MKVLPEKYLSAKPWIPQPRTSLGYIWEFANVQSAKHAAEALHNHVPGIHSQLHSASTRPSKEGLKRYLMVQRHMAGIHPCQVDETVRTVSGFLRAFKVSALDVTKFMKNRISDPNLEFLDLFKTLTPWKCKDTTGKTFIWKFADKSAMDSSRKDLRPIPVSYKVYCWPGRTSPADARYVVFDGQILPYTILENLSYTDGFVEALYV